MKNILKYQVIPFIFSSD